MSECQYAYMAICMPTWSSLLIGRPLSAACAGKMLPTGGTALRPAARARPARDDFHRPPVLFFARVLLFISTADAARGEAIGHKEDILRRLSTRTTWLIRPRGEQRWKSRLCSAGLLQNELSLGNKLHRPPKGV